MAIRLLGLALLLAAGPVSAGTGGLTIKTGETWQFSLFRGQPIRAHKASPDSKPAPGQIQVTVRSLLGTTMTISSNNPTSFTYRAELIGAARTMTARSCTLPANSRLSFEHWPEKAIAVRLSQFRIANKDGTCP